MTIKWSHYRFILLLGLVSCFSDMVYEGAKSIAGPFLGSLGARAAVIGFVFGFGEFVGFSLRFISGWFLDWSSRYWLFLFAGYLCNLIAIPLLAFVGHWQLAVLLFIIERIGKAIRSPSRDAMLSYASSGTGRGWGFGVHQLLDQLGGVLGPLLISLALYYQHDAQFAFALLAIPAGFTLLTLILTRKQFPEPRLFEEDKPQEIREKFPITFWMYLVATGLMAAGFADFPIIAYHFQKSAVLPVLWIPFFYIIAMAISAISALFFGWLYDRVGVLVIIPPILLSSFFAPLVFYGQFYLAALGMVLWGVGMGAQRSLLKAVVGDMIAKPIRAYAYGVFNTGYGLCWFLGSWLIGALYDVSLSSVVVFSITVQLLSILLIIALR